MASLYERLAQIHSTRPPIPTDLLAALIELRFDGDVSADEAAALIDAASRRFEGDPDSPLNATERQEVIDLVNTVPAGTAAAQVAARARRLQRIKRLVFMRSSVQVGMAKVTS